mmetsp:Transcript_9285/g.32030  ORF Transcript_9285/g.32030 Transcript_9285/m.32030 type:complete len:319 (-) Transcript_9285:914-1870(-)
MSVPRSTPATRCGSTATSPTAARPTPAGGAASWWATARGIRSRRPLSRSKYAAKKATCGGFTQSSPASSAAARRRTRRGGSYWPGSRPTGRSKPRSPTTATSSWRACATRCWTRRRWAAALTAAETPGRRGCPCPDRCASAISSRAAQFLIRKTWSLSCQSRAHCCTRSESAKPQTLIQPRRQRPLQTLPPRISARRLSAPLSAGAGQISRTKVWPSRWTASVWPSRLKSSRLVEAPPTAPHRSSPSRASRRGTSRAAETLSLRRPRGASPKKTLRPKSDASSKPSPIWTARTKSPRPVVLRFGRGPAEPWRSLRRKW